MPGVVCVLTRDEVRADPDMEEVYGFVYRDVPLVAMDKVRHQGDIVAVVVADDVDTAEAAAELVDVEYEDLPAVMSVPQALAEGASQVHEEFFPIAPELRPIEGTNVCHHATIGCGDVEQGFAESDFVYEDEFTAPSVQHCALDLHAVISQVEDGKITVWTNCQSPFPLSRELERIFKMPARVIIPYVGGGFGSKSRDRIECVITAAAKLAGRPVRYVLTQEETFMTFIRPAYRNRMRTGVKRDGTIVARHNEFWVDVGGYAISGARSANNTLKVATGPVPHPERPGGLLRRLHEQATVLSLQGAADDATHDVVRGAVRPNRARSRHRPAGDTPQEPGARRRHPHHGRLPPFRALARVHGAGNRGHWLGRATARRTRPARRCAAGASPAPSSTRSLRRGRCPRTVLRSRSARTASSKCASAP